MLNSSNSTREAIAQILQWSADAQVARRKADSGSAAFYTLTGSVAAYAKVLALLTALQRAEAFYGSVEESDAANGTDPVLSSKGPGQYVAEKLSRLWAAFS